jgi:hypothetical protein
MIEGDVKMTNIENLAAAGRSPEISEAADLYGWLTGSWELDVLRYGIDLSAKGIKGEAHFGWVLDGRAVQDVWIMRPEMYGTTLRIWDPSIGAWRVTWINAVNRRRDELIGRRIGDDIVQVGTHDDGTPIRWMFTEIKPDSFRWTGEALEHDGKTWKLEGEFRAQRKRSKS